MPQTKNDTNGTSSLWLLALAGLTMSLILMIYQGIRYNSKLTITAVLDYQIDGVSFVNKKVECFKYHSSEVSSNEVVRRFRDKHIPKHLEDSTQITIEEGHSEQCKYRLIKPNTQIVKP